MKLHLSSIKVIGSIGTQPANHLSQSSSSLLSQTDVFFIIHWKSPKSGHFRQRPQQAPESWSLDWESPVFCHFCFLIQGSSSGSPANCTCGINLWEERQSLTILCNLKEVSVHLKISKHFTSVVSPFYKGRNWGTEKLSDLPKVTEKAN